MSDQLTQEVQEIKLAINQLQQNDQHISKSLSDIAESLKQLVKLQNDHDVLRVECFAKIDENARVIALAHTRIDDIKDAEKEREKSRNDAKNWALKGIATALFIGLLTTLGLKQ